MSKIKVSSGFTQLKLALLRYSKVFVVYDINVSRYVEKFASGKPSYAIEATEENKSIDTVMSVCRWLMSQGADRSALLLAVGGGVTSDIAGFAASIYKRGIRYANIPTTLLAMVDAGIGGKTGVNVDGFKNMIGIINQPEFTYICPPVLQTLSAREFRSGAAEMLKTFIIKDEDNYAKALKVLSEPFNAETIQPLIEAAAKIKAGIVKKDETETGPRRVLNLGHTYGHAIEWWQAENAIPDPYTHGEAVAIGIIQAAVKSENLGKGKPGLAEKLRSDFKYCGLPTELPCSDDELRAAILQDKKAEGDKLYFVFIKDIGKVTVEKI